ncbi:2-polyprenyl-6-hydroxyphenyl methylase/3-demethylubiquinone-9 3-methyltransferase [Stackebrandtia endophytica]|uniref:2-polyprenyl-6-hydroxyphenyl methylase/3-demethylubiquinone-9 3-methyltransferase n=1 Tax=Stackebrandtia endophytica TaxID=1496996 RepID=A0A543AXU9_9ACTN|nr:methyltransferase domain-containing protein [Stackebrandtia endophytica]TQL77397.1 2-polyprenyl-6-hydroxyphenyl methylase/3-demethylubiquinone-9 3-methyltransferase [Stackebrandtia endophytica]
MTEHAAEGARETGSSRHDPGSRLQTRRSVTRRPPPPPNAAHRRLLARNDPRQYDDLAEHWWEPNGPFAMLHWLAEARCALIPPPTRDDAILVDVGCGGGLNAPHVSGYHHIGLDLRQTNADIAARHNIHAIRADAAAIPIADESADVVIAGEILEHVPDWAGVVAQCCRILRPGGTLVVDTLAKTLLSRIVAVHLAERMPGGPPPGIHDPDLFVPPRRLRDVAAAHGVVMELWGIRPAARPFLRWLRHRTGTVPIVRTRSTSILYAGLGVKSA